MTCTHAPDEKHFKIYFSKRLSIPLSVDPPLWRFPCRLPSLSIPVSVDSPHWRFPCRSPPLCRSPFLFKSKDDMSDCFLRSTGPIFEKKFQSKDNMSKEKNFQKSSSSKNIVSFSTPHLYYGWLFSGH